MDERRVVVVGAGPAGAALAYLLARRGIGITLLERHTDFAREFRGEALMPSGVDAFVQMGLGARFDASRRRTSAGSRSTAAPAVSCVSRSATSASQARAS